MELTLYSESLKKESQNKHLQTIQYSDFLPEVQKAMSAVWSGGGRVIFRNPYGGYHAIVK